MRSYKDYYIKMADLSCMFAHPLRVRIIEELLAHGRNKECVQDFTKIFGKRQANISQHLSILRRSGIIDYRQLGKTRCYYIRNPLYVKRVIGNLKRIMEAGL